MTFLKDEGLIQPEQPSVWSQKSHKGGAYWVVEFQLVMIVDGRNLRYEARWPRSKDAEAVARHQEVFASKQTCIAAAFKPGTA